MSFQIKSFDGETIITVEATKAEDKTIESVDDTLLNEFSLYGEALRLRAELFPKPERQITNAQGDLITIPAQDGIDVFSCSLNELNIALEDAKLNNYRVRTEFLLRVLAVRFPDDFDPNLVNIGKTECDRFVKLKDRATNNLEFLGECGFGIDVEGNHPTLESTI